MNLDDMLDELQQSNLTPGCKAEQMKNVKAVMQRRDEAYAQFLATNGERIAQTDLERLLAYCYKRGWEDGRYNP